MTVTGRVCNLSWAASRVACMEGDGCYIIERRRVDILVERCVTER